MSSNKLLTIAPQMLSGCMWLAILSLSGSKQLPRSVIIPWYALLLRSKLKITKIEDYKNLNFCKDYKNFYKNVRLLKLKFKFL